MMQENTCYFTSLHDDERLRCCQHFDDRLLKPSISRLFLPLADGQQRPRRVFVFIKLAGNFSRFRWHYIIIALSSDMPCAASPFGLQTSCAAHGLDDAFRAEATP